MRALTFFILFFSSMSLFAQRQYTATEIANINTNSLAAGGDLYHDVANDILYIGLMTGKLVAINNTDDQKIDLFEINGSDVLSLSIESDGDAPKTVNLAPYSQTLSQSGDVVTLSNGGGSFTDNHLGTADQTLTGNRTVTQGSFDLNFDANTLLIDGSGDYVGIGIAAPAAKLHISGDVFRHEFSASGGTLPGDGSSYIQSANDGAGNFQKYWNTLGTTSPTRMDGGYALNEEFTANNDWYQIRSADTDVAGSSITWQELHWMNMATGQHRFNEYGDGDFESGNETYALGATSAGDIVEFDLSKYNTTLTQEQVQDFVGTMVTGNTETGITVTYDDAADEFDFVATDPSATNELQDLSLSGNILSLSSDPTTVNLAPYLDNTDNQNLTGATLTGTTLEIDIEDGSSTSVNLAGLRDADWYLPTTVNHATDILESIYTFGNVGINVNDPQHPLHVDSGNASDAGPWAVIEGGGNVRSNVALRLYDEGTAANNENILEFAHNPNTGVATPLATIRSNTVGNFHANGADLTLETTSNPTTINTNQLVLKNTGNVGIGIAVPQAKLDVDNGTVRFSDYGVGTVGLNTNTFLLGVDAQGDIVEVNNNNVGTDNQDLGSSASGTNRTITISGGASTTISVADNDNDSTNEIQDLSLTGNTLSLSSDATPVNLAPYLDNTDDQRIDVSTFTTAGLNLSLEGDAEATKVIPLISTTAGNDLTFNANGLYINETDSQNLGSSASGTNRTITISGGASTTLSVADNDNDPANEIQTLSRVGDVVTLSSSGGTFTDDHLGTTNQTLTANRTVTQGNFDLNFDANTLVIDGSANNVGIGSTAPSEKLLVAGNIQAGEEGVGSMAMTINDGQGNANLTFNHTRGVPDGAGSSARITSGVDAASAYLGFELASNVTAGTSINTLEYMRIQDDGQLRLNEYGDGDFTDNNETYQLAVAANGDIVEMNTAKSSKIFYPPAIVIDVSTESGNLASPGDESINLYTRYTDAYATPDVRSPSAPAAIPTYSANELYYYITDYDTNVFANVSVTDAGVMTYDVIDVPASNCTYINVVFVVK